MSKSLLQAYISTRAEAEAWRRDLWLCNLQLLIFCQEQGGELFMFLGGVDLAVLMDRMLLEACDYE